MSRITSHNIVLEFAKLIADNNKRLIDRICDHAPFDKTFKGRVVEVKNHNKYIVLINGTKITASAHEDYVIDDFVWVKYPRNKVQNAFIVCKS